MKKIIGVLGLGRFGSAIVETLSKYDYEVIAVDSNKEKFKHLENQFTKGVVGDITDLVLLQKIGLSDCKTVVIASGSSLESSVLAVLNCKKLQIPHIVAKAPSLIYKEVLEEMGADQVIMPEKQTGIRIAKSLMRTYIEDTVNLDNDISVVEFHPPKSWVGKTLQELDLRNKYDINIIGLKESKDKPLKVALVSDTVLKEDVLLVGISESENFERYDYINKLK